MNQDASGRSDTLRDMVNTDEAARALGCSTWTIRNYVRDGRIVAPTKRQPRILWHRDVFEEWLRTSDQAPEELDVARDAS